MGMKLCSEYPCPNEAKYRIGGFEDYDTYCLEHWAIEQKDAVTALREQIAREIFEIGIPELPQGHENNSMFKAIKTAQEVMRLRAADKARGK